MKRLRENFRKFISNIGYMFCLIMKSAPLYFILAIVMSVFTGLGTVFQAYFLSKILDGLTIGLQFTTICLYAVAILAWNYVTKLQNRMLFSMNRVVTEDIGTRMEKEILEAMDHVDAATLDNPQIQNRIEQAKNLTKRVPHSIFMNLLGMLGLIATTIGFITLLWKLEWWYVFVILLSSVFIFIINNRYEENVVAYLFAGSVERRKTAYYSSLLTQRENIEEIHQYNAMGYFKKEYAFNAKKQINRFWGIFRSYSLLYTGAALISYIGCGLVYILILRKAFLGEITVGEVTMYLTACITLQGITIELIDGICALPPDCIVLENYTSLLKELNTPKKEEKKSFSVPCSDDHVCIQFEDVSFSYPNTDHKIFEHASFTIQSGQRAAIVGINGSGKTTLVRLLSGMYTSFEGNIYINGVEIRSMSPEERQKAVAVMYQNYLKPSLSVKDAVTFGAECSDEEQKIKDILKQCDFSVENLDTELTKQFDRNGLTPSGGQWQRLALARMLFRDCSIYVLDEPSAALDPQAEDELFKLIEAMSGSKTVLFITHRLASVRNADTIIFIDSAGTVWQAAHSEMMNINKEYNSLYTKQASKYTD